MSNTNEDVVVDICEFCGSSNDEANNQQKIDELRGKNRFHSNTFLFSIVSNKRNRSAKKTLLIPFTCIFSLRIFFLLFHITFLLKFPNHIDLLNKIKAVIEELQQTNIMMFTRIMEKLSKFEKKDPRRDTATTGSSDNNLVTYHALINNIPCQTVQQLKSLNDALVDENDMLMKLLVCIKTV